MVDYNFDELHEGKLKYFINFKQKDFEDEISNKFNFLRGEEISLWDIKQPIPFGKILKINYPTIEISVDNLNEEVCIPENNILVGCVLKGERDKIKRLSHTIDIIFSKNKEQIPNENLRSILIDASKADSTEGDILQTEEYQKTLDGISTSLLSKHINSRQIEAIAKCILSKDLFVIQGPPGTGKSTAISELIWQHIRVSLSEKDRQYRVLVTSETNLAVDNALDKLRSKNHMLIKPIRFGSQEKLDKEGRHFCLESLKTWAELDITSNTDKNIPSNIIEDWISIIANRSKRNNAKNETKLMERWFSYLENSNNEIRILFYNSYIKNANVIGATCSSIGKLNSEDKPTRFMKEYCNIVYPEMTKISKSDLKSKNINFDLVVQDEASKASPPELALPCLFGKKAVVIGDHRQLPPMVNTNDFIDNLKLMSIKTKDQTNKSEIESLIRFVKKNREEFSISHFEKLFNAINPNLKSSFNEQYRMHPAINETIKQFYIEDGGLECGIPPEFADLEDLSHPLSRFHGVTKNKNTHVIWIDVNTPEIKNGTSRVNHGEVQAVDWLLNNFQKSPGYKKFVDYWAESEIEQKEIGIITFYGAQSSLLNKLSIKYPDVPLRISPVDRFQGMERNIVIVSLVRSNSIADSPNQVPDYENYNETGFPLQESLGFAEFPNRLNVALSRAKRLLIIVGNSKHFRQREIYDRVYETIKNHECGSINEFDTNTNTLKL
jgi:superfamily I DNA and/or RNA helicase